MDKSTISIKSAILRVYISTANSATLTIGYSYQTAYANRKSLLATANRLIIANVGEGTEFPLPETILDQTMTDYADNAWHWTEENRGFGDFVVVKKLGEDFLRFCFDGTVEDPEGTADGAYYDYTSAYYSGATEG